MERRTGAEKEVTVLKDYSAAAPLCRYKNRAQRATKVTQGHMREVSGGALAFLTQPGAAAQTVVRGKRAMKELTPGGPDLGPGGR